jgi:hypothetical protein
MHPIGGPLVFPGRKIKRQARFIQNWVTINGPLRKMENNFFKEVWQKIC